MVVLTVWFLKIYKYFNFSISVTTVYPVAELGMNLVDDVVSEDDTTQPPTEDSAPTQSFFPTVAVIENSLQASTIKTETHTFVPFIPTVLPETTAAISDEPPLMAAVEEESAEVPAEEPDDIITPETILEVSTQQEEKETEPEVEEVPSTEQDDQGEAAPEEQVTDSKLTSGQICISCEICDVKFKAEKPQKWPTLPFIV